jgi:hypothetical protein
MNGSTPLWNTGTVNQGCSVFFQSDGNLVVYDCSSNPKWNSHTNGHPNAWLTLQNDGNLVIYDGGAIWNSGTGGH